MFLFELEAEKVLALTIYAISFLSVAFLAERLSLPGRVLVVLLLFYSVAPFVEFTNFQFFEYNVTYRYDVAVFVIYTVILWVLFLALLLFFPANSYVPSTRYRLYAAEFESGLRILWVVACIAWAIDIVANWNYFFLPKHEYISSLPSQTKNLLVFTIPAREILVGAALFCPFVGRMRSVVIVLAVMALAHSLMLGMRHVALVTLLVLLLPHLKTLGLLMLVVALTFVGEVSNLVKILLSPSVTVGLDFISLSHWAEFLSTYVGVSGEQKAILSNLLIKLKHPELFEFLRLGVDIISGLPASFIWAEVFDYELNSAVQRLSTFVGTAEGQGTAYSIHVAFIESMGLIMVVAAFSLYVLRVVGVSVLFLLGAEVFYSMLRNGVEYWFYLTNKLIVILLLMVFLQFAYELIITLCAPETPRDEKDEAEPDAGHAGDTKL